MNCRSKRQSGIGLVELFLGSTAVMVVVLGIVGGLMTSLKFAIDSKDSSVANDLALDVVESFRAAAEQGFAQAVRQFHGKVVEQGNRRIYARVILDETRFDPPHDLNGDGDCDDVDLDPERVHAAYVQTKVMWGRNNSETYLTLVDCSESPRAAAAPAR